MEVYVKLAEIESFLNATREHIRSSRRNEPILGELETYRPLIDSIAEALGLDGDAFRATLRHSEAAYDARLLRIEERNARHAARERHEQQLLAQREADARKRAREREEEQYAERWRKLGKARPGGGGGL